MSSHVNALILISFSNVQAVAIISYSTPMESYIIWPTAKNI